MGTLTNEDRITWAALMWANSEPERRGWREGTPPDDPDDVGPMEMLCRMIGFDIEKVAELINLPEDHVMGPMVAIGKGIKDPWPKPGQLPLEALVVENLF